MPEEARKAEYKFNARIYRRFFLLRKQYKTASRAKRFGLLFFYFHKCQTA